MIVKCGRKEYDLTEKDRILWNGACYMIMSIVYFEGFYRQTPMLANYKAKNLIKEGKLVETKGNTLDLKDYKWYKIA